LDEFARRPAEGGQVSDFDDVTGDLENYLQTVERAEEFDKKITNIDDLIDEIVTSCTDSLTRDRDDGRSNYLWS
jgi:hypothetical protein